MGKRSVSITVLVENTATMSGLKGEHGLSIWIETQHGTILWDTGQSGLLRENADLLGIPVHKAEHIVISHGHYDHTGGVLEVLRDAPESKVYAHPGIFTNRFTPDEITPEKARYIGNRFDRKELEKSCGMLELSSSPTEIVPGVFMTGEIPRRTDYEDVGGDFFLDEKCTIPDTIPDDQSLVIETDEGLIVVLGCCHAGLINTLNMISEHWRTKQFLLIAGGMHLIHASKERLIKTVEALDDFSLGMLSPGHCTGWSSQCYLGSAFPDSINPLHVGWTWTRIEKISMKN